MYIKELRIRHFRGLSDLLVRPKGHIVAMGEPGSGRSDLIEALIRTLKIDSGRDRTTTELDFWNRDISKPIRIALTLGELGDDLEQDFFDHLELWDKAAEDLLQETDDIDNVDKDHYEWVLRLEYMARWLGDEERCEEWVFYSKESDPASESYVQVRRRDMERLGFNLLRWSGGRILDLSYRSAFRRVIGNAGGNDFTASIAQYVDDVGVAASHFTGSSQVTEALDKVVTPLKDLLGISATDMSQLFRFAPEGGSPSGLLRSLGPAMDVGDGIGSLPLWRRGSSTAHLFRIAEALALSPSTDPILAVDDFGDGLDSASAAHMASVMRRSAGQAWVTTRTPAVAEVFEPQEVLRLGIDTDGTRYPRQGKRPETKAENIAAKHWHRILLPALSYRSVIVVEGPNDFAALHNLALRLSEQMVLALPATQRIALINAGSGGSGGYANVLKLARAARDMGLRSVGIVDGDVRAEARQYLSDNIDLPNAVIRLPDSFAIEVAIIDGITDEVLRQALRDITLAAGIVELQDLDQLSGSQLSTKAVRFIKGNSLHGPFIDALPEPALPPQAVRLLTTAVEVAVGTEEGLVQL